MIIVICAIIGFIIGLIIWILDGCFFDDFLIPFGTAFVGFVWGLIILFGVQPFFSNTNFDSDLTETTNLVPITDGSAFIFSSYSDGELQYVCLYESEHGLTTKTIDANNVYLCYTNGTPIIEKYVEKHPNRLINWLFALGNVYYIIYIPEGSAVMNQYSVNLQ